MGIHHLIIEKLKEEQKENQNPLAMELETVSTDDLVRRFFLNYRGGDLENSRGLRITHTGLAIMNLFFTSYEIQLGDDYRAMPRHLLYLDRTCTMPWHLYMGKLTLFEERLAVKLKLVGNMDDLIHSFPQQNQ